MNSIAKFLNYNVQPKDIWIVYELGSLSLGKHLFDVKGEFFKGERIYNVGHQPFFNSLRRDPSILKDFLRHIAKALFAALNSS